MPLSFEEGWHEALTVHACICF